MATNAWKDFFTNISVDISDDEEIEETQRQLQCAAMYSIKCHVSDPFLQGQEEGSGSETQTTNLLHLIDSMWTSNVVNTEHCRHTSAHG